MRDFVFMQLQRGALPIVLILALSFVLNILGITWGLPHYVDWAQDSMALETLAAISKRFSHGWSDKYPPVHYAVLAAFYTPYIGYLLLSGGLTAPSNLFPYGLTDPLSALTHFILIARGVSILMGVAIVLLVYVVVCELFSRRAAFFAALLVTLNYPFVYYAHNANADVPYLFWALLAIYYFLRLLKDGHLKHYVLFALFGTLSICTKDQAYGLFLLSPLPILWIRFTEAAHTAPQRPTITSVLFERRLLIGAVVAVGTFILAQNLLFNFSGFVAHVQEITGKNWQPYVQYAPTLAGRLQLLWATSGSLARICTLPLFGVCIVGALYCALKFPRYSLPLLFLAASYYLTFLNVIRREESRFLLPISIILAFFGGKLLAELWDKGPWKTLQRGAICLALAYAALYPLQLDFLLLRGEGRYAAERWMQEHFKTGTLVETFARGHLHLEWYYPRFPSWVKVRMSQLEAGTQWLPHQTPPNKRRFPNLYFGREAPDYIVLKFWDEGANIAQELVVADLFHSRLDYTLAATFKTPVIVPIELAINPCIYIFTKTGAE